MKNKKIPISFLLLLFIPLIASELPEPLVDYDEIKPIIIGEWSRVIEKNIIGQPHDIYMTYKISDNMNFNEYRRWSVPKYNVLFFYESYDDTPRRYNISYLYNFDFDWNRYNHTIIKATLQPMTSGSIKPMVIEIIERDSLYVMIGNTCFGLSRKGPYYGSRSK